MMRLHSNSRGQSRIRSIATQDMPRKETRQLLITISGFMTAQARKRAIKALSDRIEQSEDRQANEIKTNAY